VILGKPEAVRLALTCLLARGHLLIEDVPGVGKTTLAHALAQVLGLAWQRVQFTSDLLPADIIGVSVFDAGSGNFTFRKGPMFTQLLLADEVNRASPKTQSALLEAMEERQVSVDVTTYRLPDPFFVVATQNPFEQLGTFRLPESQLDRFLMRISLGYPDAANERALLAEGDRRELLAGMQPALSPDGVRELQAAAQAVHVAPALLAYVQTLVASTRQRTDVLMGLSPRAGQGLVRAARAWAMLAGRDMVIPEDVQAVFAPGGRASPRARGRRHRGGSCRVHHRARPRRAGSGVDSPMQVPGRDTGKGMPGRTPIRPGNVKARLRRRMASWARRRQGEDQLPITITTRRVYILPTRAGLAFAALAFVMLIAGLNYANSIALLLTFLLAGFGMIAMHLTHRNLVGVNLRAVASVDAFVGEHGRLLLTLENAADTARIGLDCEVEGSPRAAVDVPARGSAESRCVAVTAAARPPDGGPYQTIHGISVRPVSRLDVRAPAGLVARLAGAARAS
jgi:MoxR-like ATPase